MLDLLDAGALQRHDLHGAFGSKEWLARVGSNTIVVCTQASGHALENTLLGIQLGRECYFARSTGAC